MAHSGVLLSNTFLLASFVSIPHSLTSAFWNHHPSKLPASNLCLGVCFCDHKSRPTHGHEQPDEAESEFSTRASGGSPALPTPWFKLCEADIELLSLQNCENSFLLFKATKSVVICYGSPRKGMHFYTELVIPLRKTEAS